MRKSSCIISNFCKAKSNRVERKKAEQKLSHPCCTVPFLPSVFSLAFASSEQILYKTCIDEETQ